MAERSIIHFQEGFVGQLVELWQGRKLLGRWPMQTRLQTGNAHIEVIDSEPGATLKLKMPDNGITATFKAPDPAGAHVFLVNHDGQSLRITQAEDEPGYL